MKLTFLTPLLLLALLLSSCGQSSQQKAEAQKAHEDSLVNAAVNKNKEEQQKNISSAVADFNAQISKLQKDIEKIESNADYVYIKKRLETVNARISTGGSLGWIDGQGTFWDGEDAKKAYRNAEAFDKEQKSKISDLNAEIAKIKAQINTIQSIKPE